MQAPRIMVVEDERIIALHLRQQLEKLGYQVVGVVASGEQALENVRALEPDVMLMDIHIEGPLDGIETAARMPEDLHDPGRLPHRLLGRRHSGACARHAPVRLPPEAVRRAGAARHPSDGAGAPLCRDGLAGERGAVAFRAGGSRDGLLGAGCEHASALTHGAGRPDLRLCAGSVLRHLGQRSSIRSTRATAISSARSSTACCSRARCVRWNSAACGRAEPRAGSRSRARGSAPEPTAAYASSVWCRTSPSGVRPRSACARQPRCSRPPPTASPSSTISFASSRQTTDTAP